MRAIPEPCGWAVGGSPSDTKQHHEVDVRVFEYPNICQSRDLNVMSNMLVFPLLFLVRKSAPGNRSKLRALAHSVH